MPSQSGFVSCINDVDGSDLLNRAIEEYYDDIVAAAGRRRSSASAFDIVHDLYLKLAAQPNLLRDKRCVRSYLCRAAANLCTDRCRRERFEARLFSGTEQEAQFVAAESAAPDRAIEIEARVAVLRQAIGELPERRRAVFILHRLHHLSPDEIAGKLNISRNMVDRHLRRALAHCLDRLVSVEVEPSV